MTRIEELIQYFNNTYGLEHKWPRRFEVSAELYGRACQMLINRTREDPDNVRLNWTGQVARVSIAIGPNNGIMFKNVELIIK